MSASLPDCAHVAANTAKFRESVRWYILVWTSLVYLSMQGKQAIEKKVFIDLERGKVKYFVAGWFINIRLKLSYYMIFRSSGF